MRFRFQPWQLAVLVIALCAGVIAFIRWKKLADPYDAPRLLAALPSERGTLLFLDVEKLRDTGVLDLLAGSKGSEEPDYRNFVDQTRFDYRTDLDALAAVFDNRRIYVALRGRFGWAQLAAYARSQGGACQYTTCNMPASTPDRSVSFYPIRSDVLALAVTPEDRGVTAVVPGQSALKAAPQDPIWLFARSEALRNTASLPVGVQLLLAPLADAQSVTVSAGPGKNGLRLRAEVSLSSAGSADTLTRQFESVTSALRAISASGSSADLTSLLSSGSIEQKGSMVIAEWPIAPDFLKSLASER